MNCGESSWHRGKQKIGLHAVNLKPNNQQNISLTSTTTKGSSGKLVESIQRAGRTFAEFLPILRAKKTVTSKAFLYIVKSF